MKKLLFLSFVFLPQLFLAQLEVTLMVKQPLEINFSVARTDTTIVTGSSVILAKGLAVSGGSGYTYHWTPVSGLCNSNILNPVATPTDKTDFISAIIQEEIKTHESQADSIEYFGEGYRATSMLYDTDIKDTAPGEFEQAILNLQAELKASALKSANAETCSTITFATVTNDKPTDVKSLSTKVVGSVIFDGGTPAIKSGNCWNKAGNPTTFDYTTTDNVVLGKISSDLTGLSRNTEYYGQENVINKMGSFYGNQVAFTTPQSGYDGPNLELVTVAGGTFLMGSTTGASDEQPVHPVTLSSFKIGKTEVTQAQWKAVMGSNPSYFTVDDLPVEQVCWNDVQVFLQKLNQQTGLNYRLPTEAEWEFAARGGSTGSPTEYSGSNNIDDVAWYGSNGGGTSHAIGQKLPNELGLYDMSGNVWEWCADWYSSSYYGSSPASNPSGPATGSYRVLRGGSWYYNASYCRVANRNGDYPTSGYSNIGFRVALSL